MYCLFAFGLVYVAGAAARLGAPSDDWRDYTWSYEDDKTAAWYKEHDLIPPEVAPAITTVEDEKSYIVKLECIGCPFRVRNKYPVLETWQEPAQDNSLLLNFTIDDSQPSLLLNGETITPLAPLPLNIYAFQTPANLSTGIMDEIESIEMLDSSWTLGTKYGRFSLQYEHTQLATEHPGEEWIQFDITAIHIRHTQYNPSSAKLDKKGQRIVQLLIAKGFVGDKPMLMIKDIQTIERNDRKQPLKMSCGKYAMIQTGFNPLEWDYYGKFGTMTRKVHLVLWKTAAFFEENALVLITLSLIFGGVTIIRRIISWRGVRPIGLTQEDVEAALLASEYDDSRSEYFEVSTLEEQKEEGHQVPIEVTESGKWTKEQASV
ncbi:uncharacterized protein BDR25DRAFT_213162 [Lindgomyces ingoldianus]|uniref:Uncharacterized protein n=1 Tax=Lindgomyces ingoldianus TaxID=673940 RepID=A0ACB6R8F1_9PLEO|nr:uncharacterized protein BDR25DRAFT_213162 [Lindgomyces ingoldianus]KAF2475456.1 hypothetical protein BDR25DRAFT_213162 [Lindgomyces ingoldianus]